MSEGDDRLLIVQVQRLRELLVWVNHTASTNYRTGHIVCVHIENIANELNQLLRVLQESDDAAHHETSG